MSAKTTSPNYRKFVKEHGHSVYELEAVPPKMLQENLAATIDQLLDLDAFKAEIENEKQDAIKILQIKQSVADHIESLEIEE